VIKTLPSLVKMMIEKTAEIAIDSVKKAGTFGTAIQNAHNMVESKDIDWLKEENLAKETCSILENGRTF